MSAGFIKSVLGGVSSPVSITPTNAGDDVIIQLYGLGGATQVLTSLTDSVGGDVVLTDFAYAVDATSQVGMGVFRVHGVTAVSHTFTANYSTAPTGSFFMIATEASNISGVDSGAGTVSLATGNSTTLTTGSLTPTANGDFLLAGVAMNHAETPGTWSNGFTENQNVSGGPYLDSSWLVQSTAASINTSITVSAGVAWAAMLIAYLAVGGGSPNTATIAWVT